MTAILIVLGLGFAIFGFGRFVELGVLPAERLTEWVSAIYGSLMTGLGLTLLLVGRIAFRNQDRELLRALFVGITVWLALEGIFSAYLGVWLNIGVVSVVWLLFGVATRNFARSPES
jgi:hypothetical protein